MIRRLFNIMFAACGVWVLILVWNWNFVTATEGVGPILVIALIPFGFVLLLHYLVGRFIDLF